MIKRLTAVAAFALFYCIPFVVRAAEALPCTNVARAAPTRTGARITDQRLLMGFTISAAMVAQSKEDAQGTLVYPQPQWCAERTVSIGQRQFTLWHNTAADVANASGPFDRLTDSGTNPDSGVGRITLIADRMAQKMHRDGAPAAPSIVYDVVMESDTDITLLGSYDGPLQAEDLMRFASGGYVGINARIDKAAHKVTVYAPQ